MYNIQYGTYIDYHIEGKNMHGSGEMVVRMSDRITFRPNMLRSVLHFQYHLYLGGDLLLQIVPSDRRYTAERIINTKAVKYASLMM